MRTEKRARAARWLSGSGIEIGALHNPLPVPDGVDVRYVDRLPETELRRHYQELEGEPLVPVSVIGDAEDLSTLADDSVDFVIANHLLEHLENPIKGLREMTRVLRSGGILYLALPDPRVTFDRNRALTPVEHVVDEYRNGTSATREAHFTDWVENVEPLVEWMQQAKVATGPQRVRELLDIDYSIHFHVWRADTFFEFLVTATQLAGVEIEPLEFLACDGASDDEYIFVFRKGIDSAPAVSPPLPSDVEARKFRSALELASSERDSLASQLERTAAERAEAQQSAASEREARLRLEGTLATLTGSRSWRVTAPLRAAARAARQVRGER
jgi:predicted SAM-dependent methyltransferase